MLRSFHNTIVLAAPAVLFPSPAIAQSPRQANPERPTFATHAYAVAPGYVELEQGLAARGVGSLREETSWDVNLKLGVSRHVQAALFGPLYTRGAGGGDAPGGLHFDVNAGPQAIGAGAPRWFLSFSGAKGLGSAGITLEVFQLSAGGAGTRLAGLLGAVTVRLAEWVVADAGGVARTASGTPDQLFVGITTNLGRAF